MHQVSLVKAVKEKLPASDEEGLGVVDSLTPKIARD